MNKYIIVFIILLIFSICSTGIYFYTTESVPVKAPVKATVKTPPTIEQLSGEYIIRGGQLGKQCTYNGINVSCNHDGTNEKFTFYPLGNNNYNIQSGNGKKYCVDNGSIVCNAASAAEASSFNILPNSDRYNIKNNDSNKYCADYVDKISCLSESAAGAGQWGAFIIDKV
jgi:hypothetical protein